MIHPQTTFRHHLFQIAIAERIPEIPPHTQHDQFILEMSSSEYRWPVLSHSVYLTSRAPPFATLPGFAATARRKRFLRRLRSSFRMGDKEADRSTFSNYKDAAPPVLRPVSPRDL